MENKYIDQEEKEIFESLYSKDIDFNQDDSAEKEVLIQAAKNTLKKDKKINIRINSGELSRIKARSLEVGLPYQSVIGLLIKKFNDRKIEI